MLAIGDRRRAVAADDAVCTYEASREVEGEFARKRRTAGRGLRGLWAYSRGLTDVEVIGPAPAFPERVKGRYRWHTILRGRDLHSFLEGMPIPPGWTVDIDPVTVL